jgi:hypothetical protein
MRVRLVVVLSCIALGVAAACAEPSDVLEGQAGVRGDKDPSKNDANDGDEEGEGEPPIDDGTPTQAPPLPVDAGAKPAGPRADCEGYTEILGPATNTTRQAYSAKVKGVCQTVNAMCATGVSDSRKILCAALEFDGAYYGNGYSTTYGGSRAVPIYGFSAPSGGNYGLRPEAWLATNKPGLNAQNLLECSGLTAVALFRAYKFASSSLYCSGQFTAQRNSAIFDAVPRDGIRAGDFLTKTFGCNSSTSGHVAIAASPPDAAGNLVVYETNAWKKPVRFTERNLSYFAGGWARFKNGG